MTDEKSITGTAVVPPVPLTIIGTGDGLTRSVTAKTPADQPDITLRIISPLLPLLFRFGNMFLTTVVALLTGGQLTPAGSLLRASDFGHLVLNCSSLAFSIAAVDFLKNLVQIFGKLEEKYPLVTGRV